MPRPDHVADLTPAALYHSIDEALELKGGRPTILFDEFDTVFGNAETGRIRNEEMRRADQRRSRPQREGHPQDRQEGQAFRLYTPMALAGKMSIDDVPATIRIAQHRHPDAAPHCRAGCERWNAAITRPRPSRCAGCCSAGPNSSTATPSIRGTGSPGAPEGIEDRDADVWEPLLAVAELAGGHWPERARVAAVPL